MDAEIPAAVTACVPDRDWRPVILPAAHRRRWIAPGRPDLWLTVAPTDPDHPDPGRRLDADVVKSAWLASQGLPVVETLAGGHAGTWTWALARVPSGKLAGSRWPVAARQRVVDAVAELYLALGALDPGSCPFERTLSLMVGAACEAAETGRVDPWRRPRWAPPVSALDVAVVSRPHMRIEPAVSHGNFTAQQVFVDPERGVVALDSCGTLGVADSWVDVATMAASLAQVPGDRFAHWAAWRFLYRCGALPVRADKLALWSTLWELL